MSKFQFVLIVSKFQHCNLVLNSSFYADVGYKIGGDSNINYLVLQIHYKEPATGLYNKPCNYKYLQQFCHIVLKQKFATDFVTLL